jgi:hypothetical protein
MPARAAYTRFPRASVNGAFLVGSAGRNDGRRRESAMMRAGLGLAALVVLSAPAFAAGTLSYPGSAPASGSPMYGSGSIITADVSLAIGWDDDNTAGLAGGRINIPFGNGFNEMLEAAGLWTFDGDNSEAGVFSHTYYKNPGWAGGFVLGVSGLNSDAVYTAGAEAAAFLPNATVIGQVAYNWADDIADFWNFAGEFRFYFTPNDKLAGIAAYRSGDAFDDGLLTALYEHRFAGTSLSGFAAVSYLTGPESWRGLVGARVIFDQAGSTLQSTEYERPFSALIGVW